MKFNRENLRKDKGRIVVFCMVYVTVFIGIYSLAQIFKTDPMWLKLMVGFWMVLLSTYITIAISYYMELMFELYIDLKKRYVVED